MKNAPNLAGSPVAAMENGYVMLDHLIRTGSNIDGVLKNAMNATLAIMLAVDNGEIDPNDIGSHPFLKFDREKTAALDWLYSRFVIWASDCYPECDSFLALEYFMQAIRCRDIDGSRRNSEIRDILCAISTEMTNRKSKGKLEPGLAKETVSCLSAALSYGGRFYFIYPAEYPVACRWTVYRFVFCPAA
jgi:hypothetical protein